MTPDEDTQVALSRRHDLAAIETKLPAPKYWRRLNVVIIIAVCAGLTLLGPKVWWFFVILAVIMFVGEFALAKPTLLIDDHGLRLTSLGLDWLDVPVANMTAATVNPDVQPMADFGGMGWRIRLDGKAKGLLTADGPALEIERVKGAKLVISLDGDLASDAAKFLNDRIAQAESAPGELTGATSTQPVDVKITDSDDLIEN